MIGRIILFYFLLAITALTGFCKSVKVVFTYNVEGVSLVYNEIVYANSPKKLNIDFDLGGQLIAFKPGFESQIVKIGQTSQFSSLNIKLQPLENTFKETNLEVELKKVSYINYVTNFTQEEVTEVFNTKFNQCKIPTYSQNSVFRKANVGNKKFSIGAEVLKSSSKNGSYSYPYYLFSSQKIKWYVLDNETNNIILEYITEGAFLAYFKSQKGMVAADRLKEITILSLEEAAQKFINSAEFTELIKKGS